MVPPRYLPCVFVGLFCFYVRSLLRLFEHSLSGMPQVCMYVCKYVCMYVCMYIYTPPPPPFILHLNSSLLATFYSLSFLDYIHEATHLGLFCLSLGLFCLSLGLFCLSLGLCRLKIGLFYLTLGLF